MSIPKNSTPNSNFAQISESTTSLLTQIDNVTSKIPLPSSIGMPKLDSELKQWDQSRFGNRNTTWFQQFGEHFLNANEAERQKLIGTTIQPAIAKRYISYVNFDGTGRILNFKSNISVATLRKLAEAQIDPLNQTNSLNPRETNRTERDCLVQFMHFLSKQKGVVEQKLFQQAKTIWLSGKPNSEILSNFFSNAAKLLDNKPEAKSLTEKLLAESKAKKQPTQYYDNIYGRKFDSEFVHQLVKTPPPGVQASSQKIGHALTQYFENYCLQQNKEYILKNFSNQIKHDMRPWFDKTPEIHAFVENPNIENLKSMMSKVDNGFDVMKIPYLAVRLSWAIEAVEHHPSWMVAAGYNFMNVVGPARSTRPAMGKQQTDGYGIRLNYQPKFEKYDSFNLAKSWADDKTLNFAQLSPFEKNELKHGHTIVNGASGSTNIMAFLSNDIAQSDSSYSKEHALLGTMMFLVFDGGHSVNEVMAVHHSVNASKERVTQENYLKILDKRNNELTNYLLDYQTLPELAKSDEGNKTINKALETALIKTLIHFEKHSHYAAENFSLLNTANNK